MDTLQATTLGKDATLLREETLHAFAEHLRGPLITPGDDTYDGARALYNAMIDKYPASIAQCQNAADVIAAVHFARENDLLVAIRGGGHNGPGHALCDGGLVIDLSPMRGVRVDPAARTARVEGGATWGAVDHTTHAFGLATPSGVISTTGVGGLTLGGGHGYLTRKYGLTIDNLLEADVVLADGSFVTASEDENEDLFWALRGGGGNFGVVTSFKFQLHPVDTVMAGPMLWPIDELESTLRWYRDWLPQAPQDAYAFYQIAKVPPVPIFPEALHGENACGLMWCYDGPKRQAEEAFQEARAVADPLAEHIGPVPYPTLQSIFDPLLPPGLQWHWKGDFVRELSDDAIAVHERFADVPTPLSTMHLYPIDGAAHEVGAEETAWSHRDATWSMVIGGIDPDPANSEKITAWARDYWEALHPHTAGGAYLNFMMDEGEDRIKATYRENYERLQKVKAKYDPDNRFRVNQNIEPTA
jgi:hypothetical protein